MAASAGCSNDAAKQRHYASGEQHLQAKRLPEAIIEFRNAVDRDELWGEARYKLALAYEAAGQFEQALAQFVRAADLMPTHVPAQLKATTYLLFVDRFEDARTRAQKILALDPKNVDAQILLGNALARLKDVDGAIAQIAEAIRLEPERGDTYTNLAILRMAQGDLDQARSAFEKAVATDPQSRSAWLALANYQWATGNIATAHQSLKRAYDLDPANLFTNRVLATFYVGTGRPADAETHLRFVAESAKTPAASFALADYYIEAGRFDDAKPVLQQQQGNVAATIRLAGIAYAQGQRADGHRMLDAVVADEPNNAMALLMKARWLLSEGKRERALGRARAAAAADSRNATAYYVRGLAEMGTHRMTDAMKSFNEVLRLNPRATHVLVQLSRLHLMRNAPDSAVLYAEEAISNSPASVDARLAMIRAWIARGDLNRAVQDLTRMKQLAPDVATIHALHGSLRMLQGQLPLAREDFERALQLDATLGEALSGITTLDVRQGRIAAARTRIEPLLATIPDPDLLILAAKVFVADGDSTRAEDALRRAMDIDPLHPGTFLLLGRIYSQQGRLDAALQEFDALAAADGNAVAPRLMAAMIVHTQGRLEDAAARYGAILKIEPLAALAANNLAAIYADAREHLDRAQQLAESAANQLPAYAEIQDTLGWVYYQRTMLGPAIRRFEESIAIDPDNPLYRYHLGLACSKNGEPERAREAFSIALKLNPQFNDAQQALATLSH